MLVYVRKIVILCKGVMHCIFEADHYRPTMLGSHSGANRCSFGTANLSVSNRNSTSNFNPLLTLPHALDCGISTTVPILCGLGALPSSTRATCGDKIFHSLRLGHNTTVLTSAAIFNLGQPRLSMVQCRGLARSFSA